MTQTGRQCWARHVSACDGGLSREHYFSRGIFLSETVTLKGPLPSGMPTKIGINDLVVRGLCRKHNLEASPLDRAFIDLVNVFREVERLRIARSNRTTKWPALPAFTLDGPLLERCCLKMVMNNVILQHGILNGWQPPDWLPLVVFGLQPLPAGCGLSMMARINDQIGPGERLSFAFNQSTSSGPNSAFLELRQGWRFFLTWDASLTAADHVTLGDEVYSRRDLLLRAKKVTFSNTPEDTIGVSMAFDWSGKYKLSKAVKKLRAKFRAPPRPGRK